MARRRRSGINPSVFLQQQGGDDRDQMAIAMEMLGFGKGDRFGREKLGLEREQLAADIGLKGRGQELEEKRLTAELDRTAKQEAFNNWVKEQTLQGQEEEREFKANQLLSEAQKSRDTLNAKILEFETDPEKRRALITSMSPEAQAGYTKLEAAQQGGAAKNLLPLVQEAYKKGDVGLIKQLTEKVPQEILQRPEFDWQKWNEGLANAPKGVTGGNRGLLGLLWNTPAALQNVGKSIANVVSSGVLGEGAPQAEYTKYTDPIQKLQERAAGMPEGPVVSEAPLRDILTPSNILGLDRRGPTADQLLGAIAPPVSAVQPGEYQPGAGFPRQTQQPPFEYLEGGPSAMPPDTDIFTRLRALQGMMPTVDWTMNER
jgi:hypothetical protein